MLSKLIGATDGKKTYIFVIGWMIYKVAVGNGWIQPVNELEVALLGGAGLSLRDGISKSK